MTTEQQTAALTTVLATVDAAIAQARIALEIAATTDRPALQALLVELRSRRARLFSRLASLEADAVTVVVPFSAEAGARTPRFVPRRVGRKPLTPGQARALRARITKAALRAGSSASAMALLVGDDPTLS